MPRYYFDIRDDDLFIQDDEGLEVADLETATVQAAKSLAEMAKDVLPTSFVREMAVEVRDDRRPLLRAFLRFEAHFRM